MLHSTVDTKVIRIYPIQEEDSKRASAGARSSDTNYVWSSSSQRTDTRWFAQLLSNATQLASLALYFDESRIHMFMYIVVDFFETSQ